MRYSWPLTGRAEEMRVIQAAIADPENAGILICGSAGVGKSRIAREALRSAACNGCTTRWAVGTSSAREVPLGALESWAPTAGSETLHVVRAVIEALTATPEGSQVVIGVDDVNLLDDLSTFVLHRIVQRRAAKLMLTVRSRDPVPAATQEIWAAAPFDRLDLQPLARDDTAQLLAATLGGQVDPDDASRLWRLTHGNALYLRNIVEQEVTDGRLVQQNGYWVWIGDPVVPAGLADIIESRIGTLPTAVADVLDALAVSEPIELAALERITDAAAVEEADIRGLISVERVGDRTEVRVAHPLYALVRQKRAAPTRLRRMRGLVATELANADGGDDIQTVVQRAKLSLDSDLTLEPDLLLTAARGAVWLTDLPLADRLAEAAMRTGAGQEAYFIRAHALSALGRSDEANAVLISCPSEGFTDADNARLIFLRASTLFWALSDPAGAKKLVDDAWHAAPEESRGCLEAFLTVYWASMGDPAAAMERSKNLVLEQLPGLVAIETAWAITSGAGDAGRIADAVAAAAAGYRLLTPAFDAPLMGVVLADAHVGALLLAGMVGQAEEVAHRLAEEAVDLPGSARLLTNLVAGRAALGAGRLGTACSLLEPLSNMLSVAGEAGNGAWYKCLIHYAIALGIRSVTDGAAAALELVELHRHPSWQCVDHERALAHAWAAASQGAVSQAIDTVLSAAEIARSRDQFAAEVVCLQTATQLGDDSTWSRLHDLSEFVEGPRVIAAARFSTALHARDSRELESVSREFERIGDNVAALDAAAHAAVVYRTEGRRGSAFGCAARAEALARQCGGARTPALANAIEPLPLTSREREIVMMLADGLANRAIAERLCLSVRTVETHIYRAMAKTGAAGREELAALLPRHPQVSTHGGSGSN
ncbi:transcriptional regulator [Rhodococcus jostii RHA1] [Mycobacterium shimoidei]|uniref:Transcriptional regulator [Rhodococcus jostii RHA1] n=1 Tax=Mycobacterium shimoidei TaxID=29313 RepID=A0A375Z3P0_MYCSH|nr:LuxR family transcriptional regulator [Mycobacterium shimoidei]SRX95560.1 transcriptional regulator [Rhodococcus jostii RHA1] [Mycobacterium shimoidei]